MDADLIVRRKAAVDAAGEHILPYVKLLHEDPKYPDDPDYTRYDEQRVHRLIADELESLERGEQQNLILVLPPRHGKTEIATKTFVPWYMGRHPEDSSIVATYSDGFATDLGRAIRANIDHPATAQVFPDLALDRDARSVTRMETTRRGAITVVGRGSAITGRGGDLLVCDDPIKDRKEADSQTIRDSLWSWFNQVFLTRRMTDQARVVLIQTRWHEDDLVGRLTDPKNPCYNAHEARKWKTVHIKAISDGNDPLKRKAGQSLWPKRFGLKYLRNFQRQDSRGFSALYQGEPSPKDGVHFEEHMLVQYRQDEMPPADTLRWFMASDHAVSSAQDADPTCMGLAGMDPFGFLWIHPALTWKKMDSATAVEAALWLIKKYRPVMWFTEKGQIEKAIGPFLRKRMLEDETFCSIRALTPAVDKLTRSQSIHGRMSMGMVKFPGFASWWPEAKDELLGFPYGTFDDFADFLSLFGLGLDTLNPAQKHGEDLVNRMRSQQAPKFGTLEWVKAQSARQQAHSNTARGQGW